MTETFTDTMPTDNIISAVRDNETWLYESNGTPNKAKLMQKLLSVAKTVGYVQKDKAAGGGLRYNFVSHDKVTGALRGPMADNGVYYSVDVIDNRITLHQDAQGKPMFVAIVNVAVSFTDVDTGYEIVRRSVGLGIDPSDKAVGKAISYATKYCLLKSTMMETGDDPENDNHEVVVPTRPSPAPSKAAQGGPHAKRHVEENGDGGPNTGRRSTPATDSAGTVDSVRKITGAQQRFLFGKAKELGVTSDRVEEIVREMGFKDEDGHARVSLIPVADFDAVLGRVIASVA